MIHHMENSYQDKLLEWKANKSRINRVYRLYKRAAEEDPNIVIELFFHESYEHLNRLYTNYLDSNYAVLNYSERVFLNDAEYRINDWYLRQTELN